MVFKLKNPIAQTICAVFVLCFISSIDNNGYANTRTDNEIKSIAVSYYNNTLSSHEKKCRITANDLDIISFQERFAIISIKEDGFFIIATDDQVDSPILGYSQTQFNQDDMPPAFKWWLEAISISLSDSGNNNFSTFSMPDGYPDHIEPLIQTKWSQWRPYNDKIPYYITNSRKITSQGLGIINPPDDDDDDGKDSVQCPTGCVATAMSQIMNYHKYPDHGELRHAVTMTHGDGSISIIGVDFENTFFDWDHMINNYTYHYIWDDNSNQSIKVPDFSDVQGDAVATLMQACGVSCNTNYKPTGSGGYFSVAAEAFSLYFKYNHAFLDSKKHENNWMKTIYKFLIQRLPILYRGGNSNESHAFIIDGFDNNGKVHINWGWGGRYDGYFNINQLNPPKNENENYNFSIDQQMILVKPYTLPAGNIKEVSVVTPGTLSTLIPEEERGLINGLKISGQINGSDIILLRELCGLNNNNLCLELLDLTDAKIVSGGESYYNGHKTKDNEFPEYSFYLCSGLLNIKLPQSITSIGEFAFYGCDNLAKIEIPNNVTTINQQAFYMCSSLRSVRLHKGTTNFKFSAFGGCSLLDTVYIDSLSDWMRIDFPYDYSSNPLSNGASLVVSGNELKNLVIPNNIRIVKQWFIGCSSIESIVFNKYITEIKDQAFQGCSNLQSLSIPGNIKTIGYAAFENCENLKSVELSDGVNALGNYTFCNDSNLVSIRFSSSLFDIPDGCFLKCNSIVSIELPQSINSIGNSSFKNCMNLSSIMMSDNVQYIGEQAFANCINLQSLSIPNSVQGIGPNAFSNCYNMKTVEFGSSLKSISYYAFENCRSLKSIKIPKSVQSFGLYSNLNPFVGCSSLESMTVDSENTYFDSRGNCNAIIEKASNKIISGCKLSIIPEDINIIGQEAFKDIVSLKIISLPENLSIIQSGAFMNSASDRVYSFMREPCTISFDSFYQSTNYAPTAVLYVPIGCKIKYQSDQYWSLFPRIEEFDGEIPIPLIGDVNSDGEVNIADINEILNMILVGIQSNNCDVNEDGDVSIADINSVIDLILSN